MNKKLYLECFSGISGDMMVAALLDLGADQNILLESLKSLKIDGFKIEVKRVLKSGIDACDFNVILDDKHENHDHDMQYLYGKANLIEHHHHEHRGLQEIIEIIEGAEISAGAKEIAVNIFNILAQAESKAHGIDIKEVHFHEVGAVDSIVDIISVAVCLDNLGIKEVIVPALYEGTGFVRSQHGILPIPVPAVINIVRDNEINLHLIEEEGEFVTPTGAAIVAAIKTSNQLPAKFQIENIGLGAGKRNYARPSILRAMIIKESGEEKDYIYKLESNIDDCNGEALGYVMERLMAAGAKDVHYTPVYMKKNRPAYQLNVICQEDDIEKLEDIIFLETTTIGIRKQKMERRILKREIKTVNISLGKVQVKVCHLQQGVRVYPEYSSIKELCQKYHRSYQDIYELIVRECNELKL